MKRGPRAYFSGVQGVRGVQGRRVEGGSLLLGDAPSLHRSITPRGRIRGRRRGRERF
jgi:hypothetical protein